MWPSMMIAVLNDLNMTAAKRTGHRCRVLDSSTAAAYGFLSPEAWALVCVPDPTQVHLF